MLECFGHVWETHSNWNDFSGCLLNPSLKPLTFEYCLALFVLSLQTLLTTVFFVCSKLIDSSGLSIKESMDGSHQIIRDYVRRF